MTKKTPKPKATTEPKAAPESATTEPTTAVPILIPRSPTPIDYAALPLHQLALEFGRLVPAAVHQSGPDEDPRRVANNTVSLIASTYIPNRVRERWPKGDAPPSVVRMQRAASIINYEFYRLPKGESEAFDRVYREYDAAFDEAWPYMVAEPEDLISVPAAAKIAGAAEPTIRRWTTNGGLVPYRRDQRLLVSEGELTRKLKDGELRERAPRRTRRT